MDKNDDIIELSKVNPKKAINKLAIPSIISTLIMFLNTFVDSIWVSGLSADALIAIGFVTPLYYLVKAMGTGYGAGINSVISRFTSIEKYADANNAILHTLILTVATFFIFYIVSQFFLDPLIILVGGGSVLDLCKEYIKPIFLLSIFLMTPEINSGLYKARGDVKRASTPFIIIAIANIILDPILIYTLNLGISGAAYATVLASILGLIYMNIGQDFRKDIIFKTKTPNYRPEWRLFKEILVISLPVSVNEIAYSLFLIVFNRLIIITAGVEEIASFVIAKNFAELVYAPTKGIESDVITVIGATYASKLWDKFNECINYSILLSFSITAIIAVLLFIFPNEFCGIYSLTLSDPAVIARAAEILSILAFYNILNPIGTVSSKSFEGMGSGLKSLILSLLREIILTLALSYLFGIVLNMGVFGVYIGLVAGVSIGSIIDYIVLRHTSNKLKKEWKDN